MQKTKKRVVLVNNNPYATTPYYGVNGNRTASRDGVKKREFKKWDQAMSISLLKLYGNGNDQFPDITNTQIINKLLRNGIIPSTLEVFSEYDVVLTIGVPDSGCELFEILNRPRRGFLFLATVKALKIPQMLKVKRIIQTFQAISSGTAVKYPQFVGMLKDARSAWPGDFTRIVQQATAVLKNECLYQTQTLHSVALELESKTVAIRNIKIGNKVGIFLGIKTDMDPELVGTYLGQVYGPYFYEQTFSDGNMCFISNFEDGISCLRESFSDLVAAESGKEGVWDMRTGENQTCLFARRIFDINASETQLLDKEITSIIEGGFKFTLEREKVVV